MECVLVGATRDGAAVRAALGAAGCVESALEETERVMSLQAAAGGAPKEVAAAGGAPPPDAGRVGPAPATELRVVTRNDGSGVAPVVRTAAQPLAGPQYAKVECAVRPAAAAAAPAGAPPADFLRALGFVDGHCIVRTGTEHVAVFPPGVRVVVKVAAVAAENEQAHAEGGALLVEAVAACGPDGYKDAAAALEKVREFLGGVVALKKPERVVQAHVLEPTKPAVKRDAFGFVIRT